MWVSKRLTVKHLKRFGNYLYMNGLCFLWPSVYLLLIKLRKLFAPSGLKYLKCVWCERFMMKHRLICDTKPRFRIGKAESDWVCPMLVLPMQLRQLTPSYTSSCRILLHLPPPLLTYYRYRNNISPTQLVNSLSNVRNLGWVQKSFLQWLASQTAWEVKTADLVTFNFIFEF